MSGASSARPGQLVFREGFEYEFSPLHPMSDHIDPAAVAVYESMLAKGQNADPVGLLSSTWQIDDAGTEWLLKVRPGVRFHSGAPCDAAAVHLALTSIRDVLYETGDGWYWDAVAAVELADRDTIRLRLHHPSARVASLLWGPHTLIHNEARRRELGDAFGTEVVDGTGPYRMVAWSPERIVTERWPDYSRPSTADFAAPDGGIPDRVEWVSVRDERARLDMLEVGELECVHAPPADQVDRLSADPRYRVYRAPQPASMYLTLDWARAEFGFDDLRVRRAFQIGIDRAEIVAEAMSGCATPTWGPLPPGLEFYDPTVDDRGGFDPRAAAGLLDAVGFEMGADGVRVRDGQRLGFECVLQDDETFRRVGAVLVRQLASLGVEMRPRFEMPFEAFYEACRQGPVATVNKWLWQDPMDALIGFTATENRPFLNWSNASSARLDAAFAAWIRAETTEDLQTAASEAQAAFDADLPYVPLATPDDVWVWQSRFAGYEPGPGKLYPYYHRLHLEAGA